MMSVKTVQACADTARYNLSQPLSAIIIELNAACSHHCVLPLADHGDAQVTLNLKCNSVRACNHMRASNVLPTKVF
jgi:hypothetical protein